MLSCLNLYSMCVSLNACWIQFNTVVNMAKTVSRRLSSILSDLKNTLSLIKFSYQYICQRPKLSDHTKLLFAAGNFLYMMLTRFHVFHRQHETFIRCWRQNIISLKRLEPRSRRQIQS